MSKIKARPMNKQVADLLHLFFCPIPHEDDPLLALKFDPTRCKYYLEESVADMWECTDHNYWLQIADQLLEDYNPNIIDLLPEVFRINIELGSLIGRVIDLRDGIKRKEIK